MASFFNLGSRFGRQPPTRNDGGILRQPSPTSNHPPPLNLQNAGPFTPTLLSPTTEAPPPGSLDNFQSSSNSSSMPTASRKPPFFFREENSTLIVKGNFMTLAAQPVHIEKGEWLAHQVVEQYRLLECWIKIIQETDQNTGLPLCNVGTCPVMSAGGYTYTWFDKQRKPVKIPAFQYIQLVQQWTIGKIGDIRLFPTDNNVPAGTFGSYPSDSTQTSITSAPQLQTGSGPTDLNQTSTTLVSNVDRDWLGKASGFPESFPSDTRNLYRQMFRCYAHLYHNHWVEPFWHLGATKELNTCFIHFVNVGKLFDLLDDRDIVPMQPLIDIWLAKGLLPKRGQEVEEPHTSVVEQPQFANSATSVRA